MARRLVFLASTAAVLIVGSAAEAATTYTQAVYCDDSAFRNATCSLPAPAPTPGSTGIAGLLPNSAFFDPCCQVLADNIAPLEQMVTNSAMDYYLGKVRDPNSSGSTVSYISGMSYPTQTCNLSNATRPAPTTSPTPVPTPTAEVTTNWANQSCGASACQFTCDAVNPSQPSQGIACQISPATSCQRELAWTRGAFIQLVWTELAAVEGEIKARTLNLSGQCSPLVANANATLAKLQSALQAWASYWKSVGQSPPPIPVGCSSDTVIAGTPGALPSPSLLPASTPFVAGNLICAARKQFEAFPFRIAACEALARAENAWLQAPGGVSRYSQIVTSTFSAPFQTCVDQGGNASISKTKSGSLVLNLDVPSFTSCMNLNYGNKIASNFLSQTPPQATGKALVPPTIYGVSIPIKLTTVPVLSCTAGTSTGNPYEPVTCGANASPLAPFDSILLAILVNAGDSMDLIAGTPSAPGNLDNAIGFLTHQSVYSP